MIAGRRVGPFAGCALAGFRSFQPDEQGAARRIPHVADQPAAALAAAVGEIIDGTPPRHRARDGAPVRRHRAPLLPRRPLGDARERIAFQRLCQNCRAGDVGRD